MSMQDLRVLRWRLTRQELARSLLLKLLTIILGVSILPLAQADAKPNDLVIVIANGAQVTAQCVAIENF